MTDGTGSQPGGPMPDPLHPGELVCESMDEVGWNVTGAAPRLGCARGTLPRLPNGKARLSVKMALAPEGLLGRGTADRRVGRQASHELAQARRSHEQRKTARGATDALPQ